MWGQCDILSLHACEESAYFVNQYIILSELKHDYYGYFLFEERKLFVNCQFYSFRIDVEYYSPGIAPRYSE